MAPTFIILGYFHFVSPTLLVPLPGPMPYGLPRGSLNLAKFGVGPQSVRGDQGFFIMLQVASWRNVKHVLLMSDCLMLQIGAVSFTEVLAENKFGMEKCHRIAASNRSIFSSMPMFVIL